MQLEVGHIDLRGKNYVKKQVIENSHYTEYSRYDIVLTLET